MDDPRLDDAGPEGSARAPSPTATLETLPLEEPGETLQAESEPDDALALQRTQPADAEAATPEFPSARIDPFELKLQQQRLFAKLFGLEAATTRLEHYEILRELGRGAMGIVYAARDTKLGRLVAIKRLQAPDHPDLRQRFVSEAQAMAKLAHPNVVSIHEIREVENAAFIVMEYIEGVTLRGWLADAERSWPEILDVFAEAGAGLMAAHAKGMVHRDFKPDNVMIGDDGRVRVMDFGLARADRRLQETAPAEELARLHGAMNMTRSGALVGTPVYMSLEQLRGDWADAASDQFAFCVSLFEALHGERPFVADTLDALRDAIETKRFAAEPRPTRVPTCLRDIVVRGLEPDPKHRFPSMQALLDALEQGRQAAERDEREPPAYVFVAHDSADKLLAMRVCEGMLDEGVRPWIDVWDLPPGTGTIAQMFEALREAPAVLVCRGAGGWTALEREYGAALRERIEVDPTTVHRVALAGVSADVKGADDTDENIEVALDDSCWTDAIVALAKRIGVDRERTSWLTAVAERAKIPVDELSPYRGLEAFREQDARWMFGREQEVAALLDRVRGDEARFLTLIGASGSGKSSLLMGGLCPMLRHGALGQRDWSIASLRPGPRPCEALAHAIVNLEASGDAVEDALKVKRLRTELLDGDDMLRLIMGRRDQGRVLLVIDQLEELFTEAHLGEAGEPHEALAFVRNLLTATQELVGVDGRLWIVATLRADFVQRSLEIPELAKALQIGTYFALPPMSEEQIRAAIERPAARVGFRVEAKLVEKLVAAAAHQAGRLPLLQHVLRELWARRDEGRRLLCHAVYAETGGLEGAIAVAAERALDGLRRVLGEAADRVTRRVMTRLVHLGDRSSGDTRRRARIEELGDDVLTQQVLDAFVRGARVLVAAEVDGVEALEITHEALLREWTTLVGWLDADRDALRLRQELAKDAGRRGSEYLWGSGRVEEARRVLAASVVELNEVEQGFLDASERSVRKRRQWIRGATLGALAIAAAAVAVVQAKNEEISAQNLTLTQTALTLEEQNTTLEQQNTTLIEQERGLQDLLSMQRGLRAKMLIPENREGEALLLGIQAVGAYGPDWTRTAPVEAIDGLERVLAQDAFVVDDSVRLEGHENTVSSRSETASRGN